MSEHSGSDIFRYHGTSFKLGDCGVSIMNSDLSDSGTWSCHVGNTDKSRIESQSEFTVRVSGNQMLYISFLMKTRISTHRITFGGFIYIKKCFDRWCNHN